jgi:hypothetical protein
VTYFADLTRYAFGKGNEGSDDLNVGWLARGHEFSRGNTPRKLVEALLVCATRPVRLYRGRHFCDLCNEEQWFTMELDGREIALGNGEVRVHSDDGRWYTAPTLVAHYVAEHAYLPPRPFVDAVLREVATTYVVRGEQLRRLEALARSEQLAICLRVLAALDNEHVTTLIPRIADAANGDPDRDRWADGWRDAEPRDMLRQLEQPLYVTCQNVVRAFTRQRIHEARRPPAHTVIARLLEQAADHGIGVRDY